MGPCAVQNPSAPISNLLGHPVVLVVVILYQAFQSRFLLGKFGLQYRSSKSIFCVQLLMTNAVSELSFFTSLTLLELKYKAQWFYYPSFFVVLSKSLLFEPISRLFVCLSR